MVFWISKCGGFTDFSVFSVNLNIFEYEAKASAWSESWSVSVRPEYWGCFMSNSIVVQYLFVLLYSLPIIRCHVQLYLLCNYDWTVHTVYRLFILQGLYGFHSRLLKEKVWWTIMRSFFSCLARLKTWI